MPPFALSESESTNGSSSVFLCVSVESLEVLRDLRLNFVTFVLTAGGPCCPKWEYAPKSVVLAGIGIRHETGQSHLTACFGATRVAGWRAECIYVDAAIVFVGRLLRKT